MRERKLLNRLRLFLNRLRTRLSARCCCLRKPRVWAVLPVQSMQTPLRKWVKLIQRDRPSDVFRGGYFYVVGPFATDFHCDEHCKVANEGLPYGNVK